MSFFTNKNILITGAAGLIGHSLVKILLNHGSYIRATQYKTKKLNYKHNNLEIINCDLNNIQDCEKIVKDMDIVINASACVRGSGAQLKNPTELVRNNIFQMINIIDASVRENINLFSFIGSSTMYPNVSYPVKEDEGFNSDPYKTYEGVGWVKRYCEKLCMYYHKITNTKFSIVRTTAVYGPYDNFGQDRSHVIPDLIMKSEHHENPFYVWGDGTQIRDFIYVDDFVSGLLLTIEKHSFADPINIATGIPISIKNLVETITKTTGYNPKYIFDSTKPTAIPIRLVNVEKAKNILGWQSSISLKTGIENTIDWYRNNKNLI